MFLELKKKSKKSKRKTQNTFKLKNHAFFKIYINITI